MSKSLQHVTRQTDVDSLQRVIIIKYRGVHVDGSAYPFPPFVVLLAQSIDARRLRNFLPQIKSGFDPRQSLMARLNPPQPLLGIALVIGAASCFAIMDTTVRYVVAYFSVALVLWTRYGLHAAFMTLWIALSKQRSFRSANPMFQIARGALLAFRS